MFSLGRLPKLTRDRDAALEFVPIGQRVISPEKRRGQPQATSRVGLTAEKVHNANIESSFDETTHQFDSVGVDDVDFAAGTARTGNPGWSSRGKLQNVHEERNYVPDAGQSSIQSLQADSQRLRTENYNLKVEVATLKQYLKQAPPETWELVQQNTALKQELLKTQDELEKSKNEARSAPQHDLQHNRELEALKRLYKESLDEKDHEIHKLQRIVDENSRPLPPQIPQELLNKVEFLQNENQSLLRQLEGAAASSDKSRGQYETENNELKLELHRLRAQLSEIPSNASEKLTHLERANDTLQQKMRSMTEDLQQAETERDSVQSSLRNLQELLDQKKAEIDRLLRSKEESVSTKSRSLRDTEARLERALHESDDLRLKLKRAEAALALAREEKSTESQRFQRKLDTLSKELKEKDREEYDLRAQVRSLMDERNRAFDNQATVQHYQAQIDTLRGKEKALFTENMALKEEMAKLQDEMYSRNTDSNRAAGLRQENADLHDRLDFYEREYALTQEAMEGIEAELEAVKSEQKRRDAERHSIETELESLRVQLRRTQLNESRKYNESAFMELEDSHRKHEEAEHRRMQQQMEALTAQIRDLEQQLETAKIASSGFSTSNVHSVQDTRLKLDLQDKEFELQAKLRDLNKLQNALRDKEDLVEALEERIRKLNKEYRTDFTAEDKYRENLQKLKYQHDSELLAVRLERDRLQNEVKHFRAKVDALMEDEDTQMPSSANSVTIALLETQLEDLRRKNHDLVTELDRASAKRFENSTQELDDLRAKLRELRSALNDAQQDKSELETLKDTLESDLSLAKSEKSRFESKNRNLLQELSKTARSCTRLANKVQELEGQISSMQRNAEDATKAQKTNLQLQSQIDQLGARLASANLSSQPSQALTTTKSRLQENELLYVRAKLFELQQRYMDLATINSYMVSSIRHSSRSCKDDLVKMAKSGVYPDYSVLQSTPKKVTFKSVALLVLGTVRMKRRSEKTKKRELKLAQIRSEIERDRITLMVEK
ncbi:Centrosomin N-terminal motif 1 [Metschnikowia aff. pulcherrima]|uniref:Centrosomin N-terminal motif 1 n=1 Tax=Metschnikowia aff. pulcherrima TaxID=2163413 RepID=A0A4P6XK36_9ASCO|nr:Centrosomin N-terminal motif 1 [Metschnikowia aff. pulcherrima]